MRGFRGRPSGTAVKFAHSTLVTWGSLDWILGADMVPLVKPRCGRRPICKVEEDRHRCFSSESVFLSKKK